MFSRNFFVWALLAVALAFILAWRLQTESIVRIPRNQDVILEAIIQEEPKIYERSQVVQIGDSRLYVDLFPRLRVGEKVRVEGKVDQDGNIFNAKVQKIGVETFWKSRLALLRTNLSKNISQLLPTKESVLLTGTVLGIDNISKDFREQLIKTGTIHVVVVSGQNLSIVAGLFLALKRYIGRRISFLLATITVFAYALLTGFEPPVVRASLMVLLSCIAIYLGREKIAIWTLFIAALVILFFAPQALFEVSFQLTFVATLGIMTLGRSWAERWSKLPLIGENAAVASSAYLFTAPIILYYFGQISPIGPLANILVAEAITPIMILGFLTAVSSLIFMPLAQLFAYFAYVPAFYFVKVIDFISLLPIKEFEVGKGNWLLVVFFYALFVGFLIILSKRRKNLIDKLN